MIDRAHFALAAALTACLCAIGGFAYGVGVGEAREQATQKRANDAESAATAKLQAQMDARTQAGQAAELARLGNVREIYHESQKVIEKPVYRSVCIDADGVGLLDRAAATANGVDPGASAGDAGPVAHGPAD